MATISESKIPAKKRPAPPHAFKKGQSGNPGGRKPKTEEERNLEAMCREKTPEALAVILQIMQAGEKDANRLSAAQYVIDRGWGKPVAQSEMTLKGDKDHPLNIQVLFGN